ncbi:phage major capsid protein [Tenacibaculum sp. Mcav3-52]|uniref:phage major capsid protein n=1 Tax=Tenacibaculum sp. Mcav3-52 TaxID=2917762 RepID=UPI001EF24F35|nr:phage major capsid protein [Tenacibaculum sp. Mcav3-52]MCG7502390.1 phage major capsid protein [Tenacibaculum sp. Mcav3-52]
MKTYKDLLEKRASLVKEQGDLVNEARSENRDLNETEETRFDDLQTEIDELEPKIARAKQIEENEKRASENGERVDGGAPAVRTENKERNYSLTRAIRSVLDGGKLDGAEAEASQEAEKELRSSGLEVPRGASIGIPSSMMEKRDQSVTGDSGLKGGKLVVDEAPRMVAPLIPNNPLSELGVTHLPGLVGNVPLLSHTDVSFVWADENENVTSKTDADFDGPVLKPKRVVAVVDISEQLILQSSIGIEAMIIGMLNDAYGRTLASAVLNGAGGKAPTGILNLTGVNDANMATAAAPTFAEVVKLETLIEASNATDASLGYVTNKLLKGKLKTTPKVSGTDSIMLSDGKELNGSKLVSTNLVPELTGNHPLIFGDWKQAFTGSWGGISIKVDPLTQATAGKVRLIVNAYADVQVVHPKAFAFNKKFTV